jgi:hypothetical protein
MKKMRSTGFRSNYRIMKTNTTKGEFTGLECKHCGWPLKVGRINEQ